MTSKSIELFLAIAEQGSISAAGRRFHFSQPTVSEYLTQLERRVGTTLIFRGKGSRRITLTPAGRAFLPLAEEWLRNQKELEKRIDEFIRLQNPNTLRLAASYGGHQQIVSQIVCRLLELQPSIDLQLSSIEVREIPAAIEQNAFDAVFSYGEPPEQEMVRAIPIFREPRYILCPGDTPLPERLIAPEELDPRFEVVHSHQRGDLYQKWHHQHFFQGVKPFFEVSNLATAHNYLSHPNSWVVVPASVAMNAIAARPGELVFRRLQPGPPPRTCCLLVSKCYFGDEVLKQLLRCCEEYVEQRPFLEKVYHCDGEKESAEDDFG